MEDVEIFLKYLDIKNKNIISNTIAKSFGGCNRTKDDIRLKRNENILKRRKLRKENID